MATRQRLEPHRTILSEDGFQPFTGPSIAEGFVAVPREPTQEMQVAGAEAICIHTTTINKLWTANKVWRAMLEAALSADSGRDGV